MINRGAYSSKYQAIEKEKMREIKDREKRVGKERSLFLSIQTSQRQKAMEEKKRAMAEAEEKRRRKALEDRRQSQQQATDRFRSAVGRIKFSKPTTAGRKLNLPVKSTTTRCSYLHKSSVGNLQLEPRLHKEDRSQADAERLTMGKEVEITPPNVESPPIFSLRSKSPSLDDVYNQSKGSETQPCELSLQNKVKFNDGGTGFDERNSASDSNLARSETFHSGLEPQLYAQVSGEHDAIKGHEAAVFYPSVRSLPAPVSKHSELRIIAVSPTPMFKDSANNNSPVQEEFCNSPSVPDSLNSSLAEPKSEFKNPTKESATPCPHKEPSPERNCEELPSYASAQEIDALSITDSLEENSSVNLNVSPPKLHNREGTNSAANKQPVVGILKKNNNRCSYTPLMNFYNRPKSNSLPLETTADPGVSSKSQKRVRFSDQVEVSVKNSSPMVTNITDPVQIELWKKVFPKEFSPQSVPNSAFTPKLRCSLSSKTAFQGMYRTSKKPSSNLAMHKPSATPHPDSVSDFHDQALEIKDLLDGVDKEGDAHEHAVLKSLDKTPTDAEINTMWDQIRQCLQDGRKVSVPPRLFNFKPPMENGRRVLTRPVSFSVESSASSSMNSKLPFDSRTYGTAPSSGTQKNNMNYTTQKHLVYRQPNQGRLRSNSDSIHSHLGRVTTQHGVPVEKEPMQLRNRVQSPVLSSSREPSKSVKSHDASETNLSLEEQRLMQSIERINQRLKGEINLSAQELQVATSQLPSLDHLKASDAPELKTQYYYPVPPSTAPKRPPTQSHHHPVRVRGLAEATKPGQNTVKPHGVNSRNHPSLSYYKQSSHIT